MSQQMDNDIREIKSTVNNYLPTADHLDRNFQKVLIVLQDMKREVLDLKKIVYWSCLKIHGLKPLFWGGGPVG